MSNVYASPRVLVLQQKRMPPLLERELYESCGGIAPEGRFDLIPYAGAKCRSGARATQRGAPPSRMLHHPPASPFAFVTRASLLARAFNFL